MRIDRSRPGPVYSAGAAGAPGLRPGDLGGLKPDGRQRVPSNRSLPVKRVTLHLLISPSAARAEMCCWTLRRGIPIPAAISESRHWPCFLRYCRTSCIGQLPRQSTSCFELRVAKFLDGRPAPCQMRGTQPGASRVPAATPPDRPRALFGGVNRRSGRLNDFDLGLGL